MQRRSSQSKPAAADADDAKTLLAFAQARGVQQQGASAPASQGSGKKRKADGPGDSSRRAPHAVAAAAAKPAAPTHLQLPSQRRGSKGPQQQSLRERRMAQKAEAEKEARGAGAGSKAAGAPPLAAKRSKKPAHLTVNT